MNNINDVSVVDLFGYPATNVSAFVAVNSNELYKILKKEACSKSTSIWSTNKSKLNDILKMHNLNPDFFVELGNLYYDSFHNITAIILANKSICKHATKFIHVSKYSDGDVFLPVEKTGNYIALGLIWNKTISSVLNGYVVHKDFVKIIKENGNTLCKNDYFLLSHPKIGIKYIKKSKLCDNSMKDMKLTSMSGKYITSDNESHDAILSISKNNNQVMTYNAQGELIINDKCLTHENSGLYFDACNKSDKQKWTSVKNTIRPQNDKSKCVTATNSDNVNISECNDSISQDWVSEYTYNTNNTDFEWQNHFGKTVVLVESDNPWYLNDGSTERQQYITQQKLNDELLYRHNADYKSNRVLDKNSPNLGFGHSYADRVGQSCDLIEGFDAHQSDNLNIILCILFLLFALFLYRYSKK